MSPEKDRISILDSDSFFKILSQIGKVPDIALIYDLMKDGLSSFTNYDSIYYANYAPSSDNITITGSDTKGNQRLSSLKLDRTSIEWIDNLNIDSLTIANSQNGLPSLLRELMELPKTDSLLVHTSKNPDEKLSLLFICCPGSPDKSLETNPDLLEFLKGAKLAFETAYAMLEINSMKNNIQSVFDLAPVGIVICGSDGTVLNANEQATIILGLGLGADNLIGMNLLENDGFKDSGIDIVLKKALAGQEVDEENMRFKSAGGRMSYIHARFRSALVYGGGNQAIGVMADVTHSVRLQQQLERSYHSLTEAYQELQRVDKMKTKFIDTVSHELRTPLTVVRGYLELIQSEYADKIDPKLMSKLKSIRTNSDKLSDLVESMLDVARIEQGAVEIIRQETNIRMLIEEIVESKKLVASEKHQELSMTIVGEVSSVRIDARKIRDAIGHILTNAMRYSPENGKIQVGVADEGKMIHIWVKDNGIGIPTSDLEKIFDRFHIVAANELSHQVDRMGLGLPLTKGIVTAHGGKIWVESEMNKGSVFHINLPKE